MRGFLERFEGEKPKRGGGLEVFKQGEKGFCKARDQYYNGE